jgi:hypothetical protein
LSATQDFDKSKDDEKRRKRAAASTLLQKESPAKGARLLGITGSAAKPA